MGLALTAAAHADVVVDRGPKMLAEQFTPVMAVPIAGETAAVLGSDGKYHVAYELWVTNMTAAPATIGAITLLRTDGGAEILELAGDDLAAAGAILAMDHEPVDDAILPPFGMRLVLISSTFATAAEVPPGIVHRFALDGAGMFTDAVSSYTASLAPVRLSAAGAPVLRPPLDGAGWIAAEGCCENESHHRTAILPQNGALRAGERFAIDFIRVDDQGRMAVGDHGVVDNYVGYGAPVLAAADGVVMETLDGLPDQKPGIQPDQAGQEAAEISGNHVFIDHENGFYTLYGHLKPGSIGVATGDRVKAGQVIAAVGSTGGSLVPHLHFHVVNEPRLSAANGYPFVLDAYEAGAVADFGLLLDVLSGNATFQDVGERNLSPRRNAMPMTYTFVTFPEVGAGAPENDGG
jgi:murein DD-endopeptidase MepM/ murein hydrolase activator NlpD